MPKKLKRTQTRRLLKPVGSGIPTSWLDPLLTGPDAVIGMPPYTCRDIERLLSAIRKRMFPNARGEWRRGKGVEVQTETLDRRPLHRAGWVILTFYCSLQPFR
jgi:hypothetical protein